MRSVTLALVVALLAACGSRTGGADDPTDTDSVGGPVPTEVPAASGEVRTRGVVTVLDDGTRPEICLGPVAESFPPQCSGPPLVGWDWRQRRLELGQPGGGPAGGATGHEQAAGVRWGQYALVGRWDGQAFTLTTAVPAAQYEPPSDVSTPSPPPSGDVEAATLERIARDLGRILPGAQSSYVTDGRAHIDVVYDDGSLQEWAERRHGTGVVVVTSALVDVPDAGS